MARGTVRRDVRQPPWFGRVWHGVPSGEPKNWGPGPSGDVLAICDAALEKSWIDRDRLFLTGGSYGGYLTAWTVTQDHRFKAAVAQRVYDLPVFYAEGRAWRLVETAYGDPNDPKLPNCCGGTAQWLRPTPSRPHC